LLWRDLLSKRPQSHIRESELANVVHESLVRQRAARRFAQNEMAYSAPRLAGKSYGEYAAGFMIFYRSHSLAKKIYEIHSRH